MAIRSGTAAYMPPVRPNGRLLGREVPLRLAAEPLLVERLEVGAAFQRGAARR